MSKSVDQILDRVFNLIEDGEHEQARDLIEPLIDTEGNNPTVWWLYAHAVEDKNTGQEALENVLRLNPNYPGAEELLSELKPQRQPLQKLPKPTADDYDSDWDAIEKEASLTEVGGADSGGRFPGWLVALLLAGVILIAFLLLNPFGGNDAADANAIPSNTPVTDETPVPIIPTTVADSSTENTPIDEPTEVEATDIPPTEMSTETEEATDIPPTNEPTETDESTEEPTEVEATSTPEEVEPSPTNTTEPTEIPDVTDIEAIATALGEFAVQGDNVNLRDTTLGQTLVVEVCSSGGYALIDVMGSLANQNEHFASDVEAIGIDLIDCEQDGRSRLVATPLSAALDYADGDVDARDFQRQWQPVD